METGVWAQVGLIAFFVAFILIIVYAFTLSRKKRDEMKQMPLDDAEPVNPENEPYR